jgi:aerobic carbon-monoxide dehydrogenase medium subunit
VKPAPFAYHRPQTVADVFALLARFGDGAKLLAGGQSLAPMLNMRLARPDHLIDLNDLLELDFVRELPGAIEIGSLTRHHRLATDRQVAAACPILVAAAATIGHYAIRQRGTLGGSLSHADPAAQLPLIATLLDAEIHIANRTGSRMVKAHGFFVSSLVTALGPDEMITSVRFPALGPSHGWGLEIFTQRHGDFAIVSVAATLLLSDAGTVQRIALALGGVAVAPVSLDKIATPFCGRVPDAAWRAEIAAAVREAIAPEDDKRIPAAYRKELAEILTIRALAAAAARAGKSDV